MAAEEKTVGTFNIKIMFRRARKIRKARLRVAIGLDSKKEGVWREGPEDSALDTEKQDRKGLGFTAVAGKMLT